MATTVSGSGGQSVLLSLSATQNMMVARQLSAMISSGSSESGSALSSSLGSLANSDTVSLTSGTSGFGAMSVSGGSLLFIGSAAASTTAAASTLAATGNTTLGGALGQGFTLPASVASLNGALGGPVADLVAKGTATDMLADLTKAVAAVAKVDTTSTVQTVTGTTITLSDATKITFQTITLHPTTH